MKSGGQTKVTDIGVGRQLLCKEKPGTRITSACAKKLKSAVTTAKKGMTPAQEELWRKMVYAPAVLQIQLWCDKQSRIKRATSGNNAAQGRFTLPPLTPQQKYKSCVDKVLSGNAQFKGLFGKQFKWIDYLTKGAKVVKRLLPKFDFGSNVPGQKQR